MRLGVGWREERILMCVSVCVCVCVCEEGESKKGGGEEKRKKGLSRMRGKMTSGESNQVREI